MRRHSKNLNVSSLAAILVVGASSFSMTGCSEESTLEESLLGPQAMASAEVGAWIGDLRMEELAGELSLSTEQTAQLADAFSDLESGLVERRERWAAARERFQSERGRRGRSERSPGEPGGRMRGGKLDDALDGPRPFQEFLQRSAEILDRDQFVTLAQSLEESMSARADQMRAQWREGRGDRHRGSRGDQANRKQKKLESQSSDGKAGVGQRFLGRRFGLEPEQMDQLHSIREKYGDEFRALHEAVRDEAKSADAAVSEATALAQNARAELLGVLSEEQLTKLESRKAEHMERRIDSRIERLPEQLSQRASLMSAALDLSDDQARQVDSILNGTVGDRVAVLRSVASGDTDAQVAAFQMMAIRDQARTAIRAVLDEDQAEAAESLKDVLERGVAGGHGMRGPGRHGF